MHAAVAAIVLIAGFAVTVVWEPARPLRKLLVVFAVLVAAQWLVYTKIDELPVVAGWLRDRSGGSAAR